MRSLTGLLSLKNPYFLLKKKKELFYRVTECNFSLWILDKGLDTGHWTKDRTNGKGSDIEKLDNGYRY